MDKLALRLFAHRLKKIEQYDTIPDQIQQDQLGSLLQSAKHTEWGRQYDFSSIRSYSTFAERLPIQEYDDVKPQIHRMMQGEADVLWPGRINWFAKSSGTTNDKSKFLPVSPRALSECHYRGGMDLVATYMNNNPQSRFFSGKALVLGGSSKPVAYNRHAKVGDLSAVLIENLNPIANLYRTPGKKIILMDEWEAKLEAICEATIRQRVTSLSGVPSWMLVLIKKVLEKSGKQCLTEVWPDLEVFFHGGISFLPYREQYKALIPSETMRYQETYNASEGFFALQNDWNDPSLLLCLDYGVFYEFVPLEELDAESPRAYRLEEVELNRNYAMLISTSSGLWRYKIGDTVSFTGKSPYKIRITGRTKHYINAFGEELMVDNADRALEKACSLTGAKIREYTAAPVYMSSQSKGKHQWLIDFEQKPADPDAFVRILDETLKSLNSDYEAKRYKNMTLERPELILARPNLFYDWLQEKGRLGGQHKVPRLCNTREYMDQLL